METVLIVIHLMVVIALVGVVLLATLRGRRARHGRRRRRRLHVCSRRGQCADAHDGNSCGGFLRDIDRAWASLPSWMRVRAVFSTGSSSSSPRAAAAYSTSSADRQHRPRLLLRATPRRQLRRPLNRQSLRRHRFQAGNNRLPTDKRPAARPGVFCWHWHGTAISALRIE